MSEIKKVDFMGWKDCVSLSGGGTEVIVSTAMGPRILSLTKNGGKNHIAVHPDTLGKVSKKNEFVPYGGHRVWHAPEEFPRTYQSDNFECNYTIEDGALCISSYEPATMLEKGFNISVSDDGEVTVTDFIKNRGMFDVELSIWGITQFAVGGLLVVPDGRIDTGYVANRTLAMWPYSRFNDSRFCLGDKYLEVKPDEKIKDPFKFGYSDDAGFAAYFNHGQLVVKRFDYFFNADYPNYSCNFESYCNDFFIEIECLSPLMTVEAGETEFLTERWTVYDGFECPKVGDEASVDKALKKVGLIR